MKLPFLSILFVLAIIFISCENDDDNIQTPEPEGEFTEGFFVINEGNFDGSGELTFISNDFSRVEQNMFSTVNTNESVGIFPQSLFFDDNDRAYIIANGSNIITVVNRYTFEKIAEISTNLDNPRYGVVHDDKAYVTNQASFETNADDFVTVINLDDFSIETTIPLLDTAEYIISDGNLLYVQNASFGTGSGITIINPNTNTIEDEIETGENLQNIVINSNVLFALHETGIDAISTNTFELSYTIDSTPNLDALSNLRISNGQLYYTNNNSVYTSSLSDTTLSDDPLFSYDSPSFGTFYGFEVNDGLIYIADAVDFASDGFIEIYDVEGNLMFETSVGLSPNGFYFN